MNEMNEMNEIIQKLRTPTPSDIAIHEIIALMNKHLEVMRDSSPDSMYRVQHVLYNLLKARLE